MFSRPFRGNGPNPLSTNLKVLKVGDYVDVVVDGSQQKGMPHRFYHGRTGVVFNVSKRAVGVEVNKQVRGRIEKKMLNVRLEHVRPSKCRVDFLNRVKSNDAVKKAAKAKGERVPESQIKRQPKLPKAGYFVDAKSAAGLPVVVAPAPFDEMI